MVKNTPKIINPPENYKHGPIIYNFLKERNILPKQFYDKKTCPIDVFRGGGRMNTEIYTPVANKNKKHVIVHSKH